MVYNNRFVLAVLVNGRPQKELANGTVKLPFGVEYVLRLRNKNNRRALVKILIDGENVSGAGYIIPANSYIDIKRHSEVDKAFKFVALDSEEAIDYGKNGPNEDKLKGVIEAQFSLEKEKPQQPFIKEIHHHHYREKKTYPSWPYPSYPTYWMSTTGHGVSYGSTCTNNPEANILNLSSDKQLEKLSSNNCVSTQSFNSKPKEELFDGCTVEGNSTGQEFVSEYFVSDENWTSVKVFLQGYIPDEPIVQTPSKSKSKKLTDLERENEELREKLAQLENERLRKKIKELE